MTQKNTFRQALFCLSFLLCFAFTASNIYGQATPPIIQWQYTNTPQFSPDPNNYKFNPPTTGENWFYDIQPTTDGGYIACGYAEINSSYVPLPILAKLDGGGNPVWEHIYDGGDATKLGYFWRVVEVNDPVYNEQVYVVTGVKVGASSFAQTPTWANVFAVMVDQSGNPVTGPYFYANVSGTITRSTTELATSSPSNPFTSAGEYNGLKAVYTPTLNGFIISTKETQTGKAGLLKLA